MKRWKLIEETPPASGAWNMALDDYLFQSLSEDRPQTFLRFYAWEKPTVSLGYSQRADRVLDEAFRLSHGIDVVRRITGGKLVLHDREVTYSLNSSDTSLFSSKLSDSYRLISLGLMRGLEKMGLTPRLSDPPPEAYIRGNLPCFSYPARNEIEIQGLKLVGSAQKRVGGRFLQHGSIPLDEDEKRLRQVSRLEKQAEHIRMISLSRALNRNVDFSWAVERLAEGLAEFFRVTLEPMILSPEMLEAVKLLQKERHQNPDWIYRGRVLDDIHLS